MIAVEPIQVSRGGKVAIVPITTASGSGTHPKETADAVKALAAPLAKDGVQVEFAGNWFSEAAMPASEVDRHHRRDHRAAHRVRFGDRDGSADPDRDHRDRHLARRCRHPRQLPHDAGLRAAGRRDDRHRRRDRLRAVHRHPLPRGPAPDEQPRSGGARGDDHVGSRGRVRRLHRHGLAARHAPHGPQLPPRPRRRDVARGRHRGRRRDHAAARRCSASSASRSTSSRSAGARSAPARGCGTAGPARSSAIPASSPRSASPCSSPSPCRCSRSGSGSADASNDAAGTTTHKAYDLIANGFGPGANGPILVVADTSKPGAAADLPKLVEALRATPGRRVGERPAPEPGRDRGDRDADREDRSAGRRDLGADPPPPRRRRPRGDEGHRAGREPRRPDRERDRLLRRHRRSPADLHRCGARAELPAPAAGVPLGARAAQGRADEPALDRALRTA